MSIDAARVATIVPWSSTSTGIPERLLADLNEAQRTAARTTTGPLVILAGAGTGKTRVVSRRAAYAIETGAARADAILLVTFTDKAAGEMVGRMRSLGHPGVMARTFHAAALAQLRHFWPSRHGGQPLPETLSAKVPLLVPLVGRLPGGYRYTPAKDIADTIEWAKVRRIRPGEWLASGGDRAPIPADLFARLYRDYEREKDRLGRLDFEDMLVQTVELLETDDAAAALVRARKTWFSVDEYQDTNPLAERLLELWLGDSRDLAVVGDPDQTIYSFTGASPEYLATFARRHEGAAVVTLTDNYRSSPQVLDLANRLAGPERGRPLAATRPAGPAPQLLRFADGDAELAGLVAWVRRRLDDGITAAEIAVLVRINAQLPPIEEALRRAGVGYRLRGQRFFARREVAAARRLIRRAALEETGQSLADAVGALFEARLGHGASGDAAGTGGSEARERDASLDLLLEILSDQMAVDPQVAAADFLAELDRRDDAEQAGGDDGVVLLTYHRAKGLEWDAVFLPSLEEGLMPIRQADTDEEIAEERRLLYVGVTRARVHLALSWSRRPSRFVRELEPKGAMVPRRTPRPVGGARVAASGPVGGDRIGRLRPPGGPQGLAAPARSRRRRPRVRRRPRLDAHRHRGCPADLSGRPPSCPGDGSDADRPVRDGACCSRVANRPEPLVRGVSGVILPAMTDVARKPAGPTRTDGSLVRLLGALTPGGSPIEDAVAGRAELPHVRRHPRRRRLHDR